MRRTRASEALAGRRPRVQLQHGTVASTSGPASEAGVVLCVHFLLTRLREQKCSKPEAKEFQKIAIATTVGFFIMGFIGYAARAHTCILCATHSRPLQLRD